MDWAYDRLRAEILEGDSRYKNSKLKKLEFQYKGALHIMEVTGFPSNGEPMRSETYFEAAKAVGMLDEYLPKGAVDILRRGLRYVFPSTDVTINSFYGMRGGSTGLRGMLHIPNVGRFSSDEQITMVLYSSVGTVKMNTKNFINFDRQFIPIMKALNIAQSRELPVLKEHPELEEDVKILAGMKPEWERIYAKGKREQDKNKKIKELEAKVKLLETRNP